MEVGRQCTSQWCREMHMLSRQHRDKHTWSAAVRSQGLRPQKPRSGQGVPKRVAGESVGCQGKRVSAFASTKDSWELLEQ